jgi:hypothetical protein
MSFLGNRFGKRPDPKKEAPTRPCILPKHPTSVGETQSDERHVSGNAEPVKQQQSGPSPPTLPPPTISEPPKSLIVFLVSLVGAFVLKFCGGKTAVPEGLPVFDYMWSLLWTALIPAAVAMLATFFLKGWRGVVAALIIVVIFYVLVISGSQMP